MQQLSLDAHTNRIYQTGSKSRLARPDAAMYIPTSINAADAPDFHIYNDAVRTNSFGFGAGKDMTSHDWSSLIGIVTAIVGNVLISFALNTQRYAHLRLSQEKSDHAERRRSQRKKGGKKEAGGVRNYGTQQEEIAEERARDNARYGPANGELELEEEEAHEGDPLIPELGSRTTSASTINSSLPDGDDEKGDAESKNKTYLQSPIWWLGIAMMVLGEAGNFLAYGFAPASIVSPLGVVALISNCLIAPLLLHEKFRWRDAVGVVIAVGGCVTVVLSASDSNPRLDPDIIWDLITTWEFETYLGVTVTLIILLVFASNKYGHKSILIDIGLVGLFGGYTALSTKGIASLLSNKIWKVITFPISYLLLAVLVFTAVMQIKYINRALQRFNATMVIPTQFVMFTLSVIIGSAILYRDFERESPEDAGKFVGGCALTFLGVWCITSGRSDDGDGDEESDVGDEAEEEDAVDLVDHEDVPDKQRRGSTNASSKSVPSKGARANSFSSVGIPPSLVITHDFQPSTPKNPSGLPLDAYNINPGLADRSAIHASTAEDLAATDPDPTKRSPMHATTSAPVVPTLSPYRPETPRTTTTPALEPPRTPQSRGGDQHLDPNSSPARAALLARNSITTLLPDLGPLTSPLSSSLSAIVADSLRRGVENNPYQRSVRPLRRNTTSRGQHNVLAEPSTPGGGRKRHSIASGSLEQDEVEEQVGLLRAQQGSMRSQRDSLRARSLSATLGDLFTRGSGSGTGSGGGNGKQREER